VPFVLGKKFFNSLKIGRNFFAFFATLAHRLLVRSNSVIRSHLAYFCPRYLEYAKEIITEFLKESNVSEILFVPYALRDQVNSANLKKDLNISLPVNKKA
jgi:hypothetical protein